MAVGIADDFARRIQEARAHNDEWIQLVTSLHAEYADLNRKYKDACNDLEREKKAGRVVQNESEQSKCALEKMQESIQDGSFVLLLIDADADAYIFRDEYYQSMSGGGKVVTDVQAHAKRYLENTQPALAGLPIVIKAFANGSGLSRFLVSERVIQSVACLSDFAKGFSQAHAMADFVLLGEGKERVDRKIEGVFEHFIRNPTCRHIIFGACHDNGYVRVLEKHESAADRITLLRSSKTGKEFQNLPMRWTTMNDLFRHYCPESTTRSKSTNVQTESAPILSEPSWADLIKEATNTRDIAITISHELKNAQGVWVNAAGDRVDAALPEPSAVAQSTWIHKTKRLNMRYCRMYQLSQDCNLGENCNYSHGPLTDEEKLVYRRSLRAQDCHEGVACRNPNCFYGHNCSCRKPKCKFSAQMHRVEVSTAKIWKG